MKIRRESLCVVNLEFITEKNTPLFLLCPRLMSPAAQQPDSPEGCSEKDTHDWTLSVTDEFLVAYVKLFQNVIGQEVLFMVDEAKLPRVCSNI